MSSHFSFFNIVRPFVAEVAKGNIEIYNEFSLQHEFGLFLRKTFANAKVQFERPVGYFFPNNSGQFVKKEIDISVFSGTQVKDLGFVFELKYPQNGQHPEQMFKFCQDLRFVEQLVQSGFRAGATLIFADDRLFYEGNVSGPIYGLFRAQAPIEGTIQKPTGAKNEAVNLSGHYQANWKPVVGSLKYCLLEV